MVEIPILGVKVKMQGDRKNFTPLDSLYFVISYIGFEPHAMVNQGYRWPPAGKMVSVLKESCSELEEAGS